MGLTSFEGSPSNVLLKVDWPPRELWWILQAGVPWRWGERPVAGGGGEPGARKVFLVPVSPSHHCQPSPVASEESRGNHGNQALQPGVERSQEPGPRRGLRARLGSRATLCGGEVGGRQRATGGVLETRVNKLGGRGDV